MNDTITPIKSVLIVSINSIVFIKIDYVLFSMFWICYSFQHISFFDMVIQHVNISGETVLFSVYQKNILCLFLLANCNIDALMHHINSQPISSLHLSDVQSEYKSELHQLNKHNRSIRFHENGRKTYHKYKTL